MRSFKASGLVLDCTVERTAHVTEQLAFEKMFGVTGTVDGNERTFGAWTPSMDLMRKNVLAGAALAGEKNRLVAGGRALRGLQQALDHGNVRFEQGNEIVSGGGIGGSRSSRSSSTVGLLSKNQFPRSNPTTSMRIPLARLNRSE